MSTRTRQAVLDSEGRLSAVRFRVATNLVGPCGGNVDLLQIATERGEGPPMFSVELRSDAKESMNKTTLADHITLRQPTDLPLPDQMHRFVTIDRP